MSGFETPFGLELLATVHWLAAHEAVDSAAEIVRATYAWNDRKKQFTDRQLHLAMQRLAENRWISTPSVSADLRQPDSGGFLGHPNKGNRE